MMGGGFGGCTINLIEENFVDDFIKTVSNAYLTKFNVRLNAFQTNIDNGLTVKKISKF
jgi:galactokinase